MDPVSQGVLGALAGQAVTRRPKQLVCATFIGALAGMAPDLDILIGSSQDPLLGLVLHRQFTHSLLFIPLGGLLCALLFYPLISRRFGLSFWNTFAFAAIGWGTHGLLDACTTYGTVLLWPFSSVRVAWHCISIIDPLLTIPAIVGAGLACWRRDRRFAWASLIWVSCYLCLGIVQRERAQRFTQTLAQSRGHQIERILVSPSLGNLLVWRAVYQFEQHFYIDGIRLGLTGVSLTGGTVAQLVPVKNLPWLAPESQQAQDLKRYGWFAADYLASYPSNANKVMDVRYAGLPYEITSMWGIEFDPNAKPDQYVKRWSDRAGARDKLRILWSLVRGDFAAVREGKEATKVKAK